MSVRAISVAQTRAALAEAANGADGAEVALIDCREFGQYGEGHPFFAVNIPFSRIAAEAPRLMPRRSVRCILLDGADGIAVHAAAVLTGLGYHDLSVMEGGAPGWAAAGHTLFKGVNLPSKTFGELIEHQLETPSISPEELHAMQASGADMLILDGRSLSEFSKMSIPGARPCPNAELGLRAGVLAPCPQTPIIVNCAGRTRSIIGAETLRLAGVPNPVMALRNGTQGWRLAGYPLDHGRDPGTLPSVPPDMQDKARARAQALIASYAIPVVDMDIVAEWARDPARTLYRFDVRTPKEHEAGHVPGFVSAPGGQLVQATDEKLAVRGARIVLTCDTGLRAATTAIWLMGMGHAVWLLRDAQGAMTERGGQARAPQGSITASEIAARLAGGATLLDASTGMEYRAGHIDGAVWANRAHLAQERPGPSGPIIVTGRDPALVEGVRAELLAQGHEDVETALAGPEDWRAAGLNVVQTPRSPTDAACIDHLFFVHDRHDGNLDAARRYLEWETGILAQLDAQERAALNPLRPSGSS